MPTQRKLSENELTEQMRISLKKELMAYCKDGVPRSKKIDDMIEIWRQLNSEMQLTQAAFNRFARILQMLSPEERSAEINKHKKLLLPGVEAAQKAAPGS